VISVACARCGKAHQKEVGHVNRTRKIGGRLYCSKRCFGLDRRRPKLPLAERRAKKAAYDVVRRALLKEEIKEQKRQHYLDTFDPEKGKAERAARKLKLGAHYHRDYCRKRFEDRPALKRGKRLYDRARRDRKAYADLADAARALRKLEALIRKNEPSHYERRKARGFYGNLRTVQERKRDAQVSRW
jgi:hypothetical protein